MTAEVRQKAETEVSASREQKFTTEYDAQWQKLEAEQQSRIKPVYETIAAANTNAEKLFPPWQPRFIGSWAPPPQFSAAAKFARLKVHVEELSELRARDKRLALPGPSEILGVALPGLSRAGPPSSSRPAAPGATRPSAR